MVRNELKPEERGHLARELLVECTRKMKMRYITLRLKLVRLREAKVDKATMTLHGMTALMAAASAL